MLLFALSQYVFYTAYPMYILTLSFYTIPNTQYLFMQLISEIFIRVITSNKFIRFTVYKIRTKKNFPECFKIITIEVQRKSSIKCKD